MNLPFARVAALEIHFKLDVCISMEMEPLKPQMNESWLHLLLHLESQRLYSWKENCIICVRLNKKLVSLKLFLQKVYFSLNFGVLKTVCVGSFIPGTHIAQTALFRDSTSIYWPSNIWFGSSLGVVVIFDVIFDSQAYLLFLFSPLLRFNLWVSHFFFLHMHASSHCAARFSCFSSLYAPFFGPKHGSCSHMYPASCQLWWWWQYSGGTRRVMLTKWNIAPPRADKLRHTRTLTPTHIATVPKIPTASRPTNNSSPAIARVRHHRCSQIWVSDTLTLVI